jgi:uncharacterized Zn-finger protein
MNRLFWATCPECGKAFIVDWELRHAAHQLICPYCRQQFHADQAAALDERSAP